MKKNILIVGAGGTISCRFRNDGLVFVHPREIIESYLQAAELDLTFDYNVLFNKHSTEITHDDRKELYEFLLTTPHDQIIIFFGTNKQSVEETSDILNCLADPRLINARKSIVLIGSAYTFQFINSDAPFFFGLAIGIVRSTPCGLWVCMPNSEPKGSYDIQIVP